jgi:hypothetical protein
MWQTFNVFVIKGIPPEIPLRIIFTGILPFLASLISLTVVLMVFPEIATFLPSHASYQTCQEFWIAKRNVNNIQMMVSAKSNLFAAAESGGFAVLIFPLLIFIKK